MDLPTPEPRAGDIRLRIKAAAVNPADYKIREGLMKDSVPNRFPLILGWDAAGVVDAVGPGAVRFRPGDEIYAFCRKPVIQHGTYAEYVCMPESFAALKPRQLSFEEAAKAHEMSESRHTRGKIVLRVA